MHHDHPKWPGQSILPTLVILIAAGLLIYGATLHAPFVFDGAIGIVDNPDIHVDTISYKKLVQACFSGPYAHRPLANLSFALNYYFHGLDVVGYHLINIGLHIINGLLVFLLFRITLRLNVRRQKPSPAGNPPAITNNTLAGLAAILWVAHPLHTESVTYILQRMNVMAATFYLASLWCYIQGRLFTARHPQRKLTAGAWFIAAALAAVCAWSSKENTATLPFFILLYEWFFLAGPKNRRRRLIEAVIAASVFGVLAMLYMGSAPLERISDLYAPKQFNMPEFILTQPRIIAFYISLLFFPQASRLNLDPGFPLSFSLFDPAITPLAIAALLLLAAAGALTIKKHRLAAFAIIWFLGNLAIESSFLGNELFFEFRLYLPSVFPVLACGHLLQQHLKLRALPQIIMAAAIISCATWAYQNNQSWQSLLSLWQHCVERAPGNGRAHHNLARAYNNQGDFNNAIRHYHRALDIFSNQRKIDLALIAQTYSNLGETYANNKEPAQALRCFHQTLDILLTHPDMTAAEVVKAYNDIGLLYGSQKDWGRAIDYFEKALRLSIAELGAGHINTAMTCNNLANIYQQTGQYDRAIELFKQALEIFRRHPDPALQHVPTAYNNLGVVYSLAGQYDIAISYFQQALTVYRRALGPNHPVLGMIYANIGRAYQDKNDAYQAAFYFQKAYDITRQLPKQ